MELRHIFLIPLLPILKISYSVLFDETTTSQVKKQFDGYVRFWSNNQIETSYYGSLFMGHCSADQMVDHFLDFKKRF